MLFDFNLTKENFVSFAGLAHVWAVLDRTPTMCLWDDLIPAAHNAKFKTGHIVRSLIGLFCTGEISFSAINRVGTDEVFLSGASPDPAPEPMSRPARRRLAKRLRAEGRAAGDGLPGEGGAGARKAISEEELRQRADALGQNPLCTSIVDRETASLLRDGRPMPITAGGMVLFPLDIDVSVVDDEASGKKEGVETTYHKTKGFAPIYSYTGRDGFMVACELRPGSQHSEKGAVEFLARSVAILDDAGIPRSKILVRVDSGHDAVDFVRACQTLGLLYIVKRNPRKEAPAKALDAIRPYAERESPREGKTVYRAVRSDRTPPGFDGFKGVMAVEATERTILAKNPGQPLLVPEVEVDSWWTNLTCGVSGVAALYRDHGTSEQFHSELKTDMGLGPLPSGKFSTNSLILTLAGIAYNVLRLIGKRALAVLREAGARRLPDIRLRASTVIKGFIRNTCKMARHAGRVSLNFGRGFTRFEEMRKVYALCC